MTHQPMKGVKMVEVAQFTFTPAAGAVLADWGADVIKVEHAFTGDAQRGLHARPRRRGRAGRSTRSWSTRTAGSAASAWRSRPRAATTVLLDLCRDADIFLINFLPDARQRLKLEVEDIRAANPDIIYVRGSGHGQRGHDAVKGGYDGSTFWCRTGSAWSTHRRPTAPASPTSRPARTATPSAA